MRHAKNKKGKDKTAATIILCFCLIALTSIFTVKASIDKINEGAKDLPVTQKTSTEKLKQQQEDLEEDLEENLPLKTDIEEPDDTAESMAASKIPTVDSAPKKETASNFLSPMSTETATISKGYSMDMVIYNKTLDQYMTHPGVDIIAPSGSGVYAIAAGTVTAVYEDDAYGTSIEITHHNGMISKYASLESSSFVEKGDLVSKGQQIGTIGKSALYEDLEPNHLHFELYKDGKLCNPEDHIAF